MTEMKAVDRPTLRTENELVDRMFKALASQPRREILTMLTCGSDNEGECCSDDAVCACDFVEKLGIGAPTVSHHMKTLIEAGLVESEKRGLWVHYRLRRDGIDRLFTVLSALIDCR